MPARREFGLAMLMLAVGSGAVLLAGSQTWLSAWSQVSADFPRVEITVSGRDASPMAQALSLVGLAGVVAIYASRGVGRIVVGALIALAGLGSGGAVAMFLAFHDLAASNQLKQEIDDPTMSVYARDATLTPWPVVALLGAVMVLIAGAVAVVRGRRWPVMGRKYDAPTARPELSADRPHGADLWKALDRGEDPTDPPAAPQRPDGDASQ